MNIFTSISRKSVTMLLGASVLAAGMGVGAPVQASEPYLGEIDTFGFNFPPRGWALCDGQLLDISQNQALFSLLGTTYGGDGRTTFALPDLRGRVAVHVGTGTGLNPVTWGERAGSDSIALGVNSLPPHNHASDATGNAPLLSSIFTGDSDEPAGRAIASKPRFHNYTRVTPDVDMQAGSVQIANAGGSQAFDIRNPYLGIYHAIALQGLFPSRN